MVSLGCTLVIFFGWSLERRGSWFQICFIINLIWTDGIFDILAWGSKHLWVWALFSLGLIFSKTLFFDNLKFNFRCWCNWMLLSKLFFELLLLSINRQLWFFFSFFWSFCCSFTTWSCSCLCFRSSFLVLFFFFTFLFNFRSLKLLIVVIWSSSVGNNQFLS